MGTLDLGVLVSGNGSNLQAILDAIANGTLDARVRLVLSNRAQAFALERAKKARLPTLVVSHEDHDSREAFDAVLVEALRRHDAEWIVLAGFMRILTPTFLNAFRGRVLNIHPALLPSFPGVHAIRQALEHGVKVTGCTVHWVEEGVDTGPIIAQRAVPVLPGDNEDSLAERMHRAEHELYVQALTDLATGHVLPPRVG